MEVADVLAAGHGVAGQPALAGGERDVGGGGAEVGGDGDGRHAGGELVAGVGRDNQGGSRLGVVGEVDQPDFAPAGERGRRSILVPSPVRPWGGRVPPGGVVGVLAAHALVVGPNGTVEVGLGGRVAPSTITMASDRSGNDTGCWGINALPSKMTRIAVMGAV